MSQPLTLSPQMQKAYNRLEKHGRLIKYRGGYWSAPDVETRPSRLTGLHIPSWFYDTRTIKALIRRGLAKVTKERIWEDKVYPVEVVLAK